MIAAAHIFRRKERFRLLRMLAAAMTLGFLPCACLATPTRVVSMNLCTDQLAMLIAAEGQLHSVSYLARDPDGSVMYEEAKSYVVNHGLAEEIFVMKPDLILSGTFTSRATVSMLQRLGFRVEEFAPSYSFAEIREQIRRMGTLLGREARAEELVAELDARLAAVRVPPSGAKRPLAALYYANSYTSGNNTLSAEVVEAAKLDNLGSRLGLEGTVKLPLETLVMEAPDLIVGNKQYVSPSLAYETFTHPALKSVIRGGALTAVPDKYWVCGAPFTAEAVRLLAAAGQSVRDARP